MSKSLLTVVLIALGVFFGGAIGLYGLFFIVQIIALGVEDQTKFGWTWILVFITVPVGVLVGGVLGYFMSIKLQENFNSVFK